MRRAVGKSPGEAPTTKKGARPKVDVETKFEALAAKTIADLMAAKDETADTKIWRRAIAEYGKLKVKAGDGPTDNLVRFFSVDGVAVAKKHRVVVKACKPLGPRKAAWLALLKAAAAQGR